MKVQRKLKKKKRKKSQRRKARNLYHLARLGIRRRSQCSRVLLKVSVLGEGHISKREILIP